jgi:uncharacterized protein (TIGR04255 family)
LDDKELGTLSHPFGPEMSLENGGAWEVVLHLERPPVEEVGIDLQFEPSGEKQPWCEESAGSFLSKFADTLPRCDIVRVEEIRVEKRSPQGVPQEIRGRTRLAHMTAHDEQETHFLQVGDDILSYRLVRRGTDYPGFQVVLDEALDKMGQYVAYFDPTAIRRARLRYVDVIDVPRDQKGAVLLEDYFEVGIKIPDEPFGSVAEFSVQNSFLRRKNRDALQLIFYNRPTPDETSSRFVMEWYALCENIQSLEQEVLTTRLREAHDDMVNCFKASVTAKGWALFKPLETQSP